MRRTVRESLARPGIHSIRTVRAGEPRTPTESPARREPGGLVALTLVLAMAGPGGVGAELSTVGHHRLALFGLVTDLAAHERFGSSLAAGDFDGDGYVDLAVGVPDKTVDGAAAAGGVAVFYGSPEGLDHSGSRAAVWLHQNADLDAQEDAEAGDRFGFALTSLDYNGDGRDDLVVGTPYEDYLIPDPVQPGVTYVYDDAGAIHVYPGTTSGILPTFTVQLDPGDFEGTISYEDDMIFGASLASGHRDADSYEDLVIGMPGTNNLGGPQAGALMLIPGAFGGLSGSNGVYYSPHPQLDAGDYFGLSIAIGDINDGGIANEIVIGAPFAESVSDPNDDEGAVFLYFPGSSTHGIFGQLEGALHGTAVATGDFLGRGYDQILMGQPGYSPLELGGAIAEAGRVWLWDDVAGGLPAVFDQGAGSMAEAAEPFDHLGEVLAAGDFDGNGLHDAVFGVPGENRGSLLDAGVVHVQYGHSTGLGARRSQLWQWSASEFGFAPLSNDRFGGALAVGDFDGDGFDDLAIGAPTTKWFVNPTTLENGVGMVQILYSSMIFRDGFESGNTNAWSP